MAVKKKIINIRVYFDGDQDAKEVVNWKIKFQSIHPKTGT